MQGLRIKACVQGIFKREKYNFINFQENISEI
jgi:hypothetical protein